MDGDTVMGKKNKILICEDDADTRQALKNILTKRDYQVEVAVDGKDCIGKMKEFDPALLLIDIRMPKIDGIDAVKEIRTFNETVKIIFLTAFESPQLSQEAARYGIEDYIVKPPSPQHILDVIKKALL